MYFLYCLPHLVFSFFPVLVIQLCVPKIKYTHTESYQNTLLYDFLPNLPQNST